MRTWKTRRKYKVVNSKYVELVTLRDGKYKLYKQKPVMFRYYIRHSLMHVLWSCWCHSLPAPRLFVPLQPSSWYILPEGPRTIWHSQPTDLACVCVVPVPGAIHKVWILSTLALGPNQPQALNGRFLHHSQVGCRHSFLNNYQRDQKIQLWNVGQLIPR